MERAEIMFLDKMLPKVGSDAQSFLSDPFGYSVCMGKYGKRAEQNNTYFCGDCGAEFPLSEVKDYRKNPDYIKTKWGQENIRWSHLGTCPHCGRPMMIELWRFKKRTFKDEVAVHATMGSWKITRYFAITSTYKAGKQPDILIEDIGATWERGGKTFHYIARMAGMFYGRWWKSNTRHFVGEGVSVEETFEYTEHYDMPKFSLDAELARRGIDLNALHGMKLTQIIQSMAENPFFETLWKQGNWAVAKFFRRDLGYYQQQIRIALKHGFVFNEDNINEWRDMICMLRYLNKDIHNPKYLCPANLHDAHQALLAEQNRKIAIEQDRRRRAIDEQNRRQAEEQMKKAKKTEEEFIKRREKYFDLSIAGVGFTIVCLKSIDEFKNEGDTLSHCVFRCGYYSKADSLILSARNAENNPIETIEIDLRSFKILQCYGEHDTHTPLHDSIVKTMNDNMWQVKEIRQGKVAVAC